MRIALIAPKWGEESLWGWMKFRFPYLSLPTIAAITPEEHEVVIIDENVQEIDFDASYDLAGITTMTPLANRAYKIAEAFRQRGIKVILGGVHTTMVPEEAIQHADSIVIGEAENLWSTILYDFLNNSLQPVYKSDNIPDITGLPVARRDLLNKKGYFFTNTIQTTRGCPYDCEFCSVTSFFGGTYRLRSVDYIEQELSTFTNRFVFFVDDNIIGSPAHAKILFERIKPLKLRWASQSAITIANNDALLSLAAKSGCMELFIGFESLIPQNLQIMEKPFNKIPQYEDSIKKIHDRGITILGSFIFGYDHDTLSVFDDVLNFMEKNRIEAGLFSILTPFPGTRIFKRLEQEGRIIEKDWSKYDMNHVVFMPKNMAVDELQEKFFKVNKELHSYSSIIKRIWKAGRNIQILGPQNIGFKWGWKKFLGRVN